MKNTDLEIVSGGRSGLFWIAGFLLWAVSVSAYCAPLEVFWEKSDGDFTSVTLESVAIMPDGGFLLGGSITSTTLPFTGLGTSSAAYLIRNDPNGRKLWTKDFWRGPVNVLGVPQGSIVALFTTEDGGFFCLEQFSATSVFNPSGQMGEFVIKTDASGNRLWETYYTTYQAGCPRVNAIAPAGDNGCAIAGTSAQGSFMTRFNSGGVTVWKKVGAEMYVSALNNLAAGADGGFFLASSKTVESVTTMRVVKVDSEGNVVWDKTFQHGTNTVTAPGFLLGTPDGGCMISGATRGGTDTGPLFLKLDSAGEKEWEHVWSDPNAPDVVSMARTRDGDYLCLGTRMIYDSVQRLMIPQSATLARVAAPGKIVWQKNYERSQYLTWARRLFITPDGAYGFLGSRGPTLNEMTPLLVKISSEAKAEVWARYGSATIASPAATGFLTGCEVSSLRGTEFEEPGRIMPR